MGTNAPDNSPRCLLPALANPALQDLLPGIRFSDEGLSLRSSFWACCQGSGVRDCLRPDGAVAHCDLQRRFQKVKDLWELYMRRWGGAHGQAIPPSLPAVRQAEIAQTLFEISEQTRSRGLSFAGFDEGAKPSFLWQLGMAAIFRFGLDVHLVSIGRTRIDELYPRIAPQTPDRGRTEPPRQQIILVEGAARLWDPDCLEEFEACVAYAYKARAPLFCEVMRKPLSAAANVPAPAESRLSPRKALLERVQSLKAKDPLTWLPTDIRAKLREITEEALPMVAPRHRPVPRDPAELS